MLRNKSSALSSFLTWGIEVGLPHRHQLPRSYRGAWPGRAGRLVIFRLDRSMIYSCDSVEKSSLYSPEGVDTASYSQSLNCLFVLLSLKLRPILCWFTRELIWLDLLSEGHTKYIGPTEGVRNKLLCAFLHKKWKATRVKQGEGCPSWLENR